MVGGPWPGDEIPSGAWQRTPWYLFWKEPWRRRVWRLEPDGKFILGYTCRWSYASHTDFLKM